MSPASKYLEQHRSHDSHRILRRWRAVARVAKMKLQTLWITPSGFPVVLLETRRQSPGGLYISAGVHGDEPAPVAALIDWAEENIALLREGNAVILPLFNPYGLARNTRVDETGLDLNRAFHLTDHPHLGPWHKALNGKRFSVGIMLHEDYDGQGMYAYELSGSTTITADSFLQASDAIIPRDRRRLIDGFPSTNGIIPRRKVPKNLPGLPEALVVYRNHAPATMTFEAPSEFSLHERVQAMKAIVDQAFRRFGV